MPPTPPHELHTPPLSPSKDEHLHVGYRQRLNRTIKPSVSLPILSNVISLMEAEEAHRTRPPRKTHSLPMYSSPVNTPYLDFPTDHWHPTLPNTLDAPVRALSPPLSLKMKDRHVNIIHRPDSKGKASTAHSSICTSPSDHEENMQVIYSPGKIPSSSLEASRRTTINWMPSLFTDDCPPISAVGPPYRYSSSGFSSDEGMTEQQWVSASSSLTLSSEYMTVHDGEGSADRSSLSPAERGQTLTQIFCDTTLYDSRILTNSVIQKPPILLTPPSTPSWRVTPPPTPPKINTTSA